MKLKKKSKFEQQISARGRIINKMTRLLQDLDKARSKRDMEARVKLVAQMATLFRELIYVNQAIEKEEKSRHG